MIAAVDTGEEVVNMKHKKTIEFHVTHTMAMVTWISFTVYWTPFCFKKLSFYPLEKISVIPTASASFTLHLSVFFGRFQLPEKNWYENMNE